MTANRKLYLKSLGIAAIIEVVVLIFTLFPILDGFMVHSAIGATQRPLLTQFLNWFGILFHLPSIILTFWFLPLAPVVQTFVLSGLVYLRFCLWETYSKKNSFSAYSEKDEAAGRYWL